MRIVVAEVPHGDHARLRSVLKILNPTMDVQVLPANAFLDSLSTRRSGHDCARPDWRQPAADIAVLPSISGAHSFYPHIFPLVKMQSALRQFMQEGGHVAAFCAGAYFLSQNSLFSKPGRPNPINVLSVRGIFAGQAQGPMPSDGFIRVEAKRDVPTASTRLIGDDTVRQLPCHLAPGFTALENQAGSRVLAEYAGAAAGHAAAVLVQHQGVAGRALLCGPVLHAHHSAWDVLDGFMNTLMTGTPKPVAR